MDDQLSQHQPNNLKTMPLQIKILQKTDEVVWDTYVESHPESSLYHLSGWRNVIEKTYGHKTYYLIATNRTHTQQQLESNQVVGILPIVHLKNFVFGNSLYSIPYFDIGGIIASNKQAENALLLEAIEIGQKLKVDNIELRQSGAPSRENKQKTNIAEYLFSNNELPAINYSTKSHKVRMILDLPESSEALMASFKSKFRTKIKLPVKKGCTSKSGSSNLINPFYKVFAINMRDLGSPVHSKKLFENVIAAFPQTKIFIIEKDSQPLAGGIVIGFKNTLFNPWASSLKEYSNLRPNTLLYWKLLEFACENGYHHFDFGRSTPDGSTYLFKEQWGAKPLPTYWHTLSLDKNEPDKDDSADDKEKFNLAIHYWKKLPVPVTKIIGPIIRKHVGL